MRNKLRRNRKSKDDSCPSKEQPRTTEVITLQLSESRVDDETSPERASASLTAKYRYVAAGMSTPTPLQEQRKTFCAKDIKIAPVFLHTTQRSKSKQGQPVEDLQESVLPPQTEDVQLVKGHQRLSPVSHLTKRKSSWRGQLSPSVLHSCLEEIQTSNPAFPVRTVFSTLQKKVGERLQDLESTEHLSSLHNHLKEKRKRGNESSERVPKRLRSSLAAEGVVSISNYLVSAQGVQESPVLTAKKQGSSNKLSRTHRLRQQSGSPAGLAKPCEPLYSGLRNHTESYSQSLKTSDIHQRDSNSEDVLWTDKYSPQHSREVIGNCAAVNKLQSWLKKWKLRADCYQRRQMEESKQEAKSNDSWDCGDFQGEAGAEDDREEPLCNTMLITGPPGVGKTSSVYACAQELGFKIFEVNCSSQRSGRHVLSQLKEATQSQLVERPGKDPLKPTYFSNYNINSCTPKSETLPARPKNVPSSSNKRAPQRFGHSSRKGKVNPAMVTLANYFKVKAKADNLHLGDLSPYEKPESEKSGNPSPSSDQTVPGDKKTATSLILFEEVDVIFDDDVGFLAAIETFMTTTKRPIILTTNDPSFKERFNPSLEEIIFRTPSAVNVCSYLQLVGLAENVRLELDDVRSLHRLSRGDVRRCLSQLQLWVCSGGGLASRRGGSPKETTRVQHSGLTERGENVDSQLLHCDPCCTASMLGLHPVTQNQLLNLLKCQYWSEIDMDKLLRLLAESWRGGVPLLYSNLELLLPTEAKGTCGLQKGLAPSDIDLHITLLDGYVSGKASATNSKSVRKVSRLSRRKYNATFDTSCSMTQNTSSSSKRAHLRVPSLRDKSEENTAKVVTHCLDALSDFFDLMSYLDSTMPAAAALRGSGLCRPEAFVWTGAEIKDGLLDVMGEQGEVDRIWSQERLLDIHAAVEGLGCRRCCWQVSEAWTEAQNYRQELGDVRWGRLVERLTLPVTSKKQNLSFRLQPLCAPSVSKRRYELSRRVLGSNSFSLLGNRRAVSVDYMPVLRYICRFQRAQQQKEEPARCLNYLSSTHLGLSKSTIQLLGEDFS
ncbi:ATPase family AAA domain-containing protein 5b isoform X2 [Etheostoma spectabile]|uniref:ATPase family AAA domain-containing protein 5b isoform X2 n=1 Tax=Etheostoma spectabile TaxID=54343 RepID=UPI0013AED640|nr:ATPase family AAA domain-containing protein 5-like isoform X2 [Etheostoma spectabile]